MTMLILPLRHHATTEDTEDGEDTEISPWGFVLGVLRRFRALRGREFSCGHRHALVHEHLDDVPDLDVVEPLEADAALEPGLHLADIVLEAAQRSDPAFVDHDIVAHEPRLRVAGARDAALGDHAPGDRAVLRDLERVAHL